MILFHIKSPANADRSEGRSGHGGGGERGLAGCGKVLGAGGCGWGKGLKARGEGGDKQRG